MQKKITNTPHPASIQFSLWASFLAFHSVVVFMITVCVFLSILFGHFHRLIHLFRFHVCIDEQHNLDDIFVSKFGFKTPESTLNFDKISFDDSFTRATAKNTTKELHTSKKIDGSSDVLQSNVGTICASFCVTSDDGMVLVASIQEKCVVSRKELDRMTRM